MRLQGKCIRCLALVDLLDYLQNDFVCYTCFADNSFPLASEQHFTTYVPAERFYAKKEKVQGQVEAE